MEQIRKNRWFERGTKIGFAVGEEADIGMIAEIVGTMEAVAQTDDLELFARMLRFASVTATMLCSQSQTDDRGISGKVILDKARRDNPEMKDIIPPAKPDPEPTPDVPEGGSSTNEDLGGWLFDDADFD